MTQEKEIASIVKDAQGWSEFVETHIREALEKTIGALRTKEEFETAVSKFLEVPVKFPDYDEKTGEATYMLVYPPFPINFVKATILLEDVDYEETIEEEADRLTDCLP